MIIFKSKQKSRTIQYAKLEKRRKKNNEKRESRIRVAHCKISVKITHTFDQKSDT